MLRAVERSRYNSRIVERIASDELGADLIRLGIIDREIAGDRFALGWHGRKIAFQMRRRSGKRISLDGGGFHAEWFGGFQLERFGEKGWRFPPEEHVPACEFRSEHERQTAVDIALEAFAAWQWFWPYSDHKPILITIYADHPTAHSMLGEITDVDVRLITPRVEFSDHDVPS